MRFNTAQAPATACAPPPTRRCHCRSRLARHHLRLLYPHARCIELHSRFLRPINHLHRQYLTQAALPAHGPIPITSSAPARVASRPTRNLRPRGPCPRGKLGKGGIVRRKSVPRKSGQWSGRPPAAGSQLERAAPGPGGELGGELDQGNPIFSNPGQNPSQYSEIQSPWQARGADDPGRRAAGRT
jgi:hypothetical protein